MSGTDVSPPAASALIDGYDRRIDYVRLSLTDRCTFRCVYCMPPQGRPYIPHEEILSYEEILRLCRIMAGLGISRYKVTGGEPLCRKGAAGFIRELKKLPGAASVTLTTNGFLLRQEMPELADGGLDSVTVSLDALSPDAFGRVTRSEANLEHILDGMRLAEEAGMRVKINTVPLKGVNEDELVPLTRFALERGYVIRFIELMPVGKGASCEGLAGNEVRDGLEAAFGPLEPIAERLGNGPAEYARVQGYPGAIGFISALSHAFCARCNRIRLTSTGFLKTCLHHDAGTDLKVPLRAGAPDAELVRALHLAVGGKPMSHSFLDRKQGTSFLMHSIGG